MRLPRDSSTLQDVGNSSYLGLLSIFRLEMVGYVRVPVKRPSPRQGHEVSRKKESSPRRRVCSPRRRGPPRRGYVCLGESKDMNF